MKALTREQQKLARDLFLTCGGDMEAVLFLQSRLAYAEAELTAWRAWHQALAIGMDSKRGKLVERARKRTDAVRRMNVEGVLDLDR